MASLLKRTTDSPSAFAINLGRLLFVLAAATIAFAAASLAPPEGRAASDRPGVSIVASSSVVSVCASEVSRPRVTLRAEGIAPGCGARYKWEATGGRLDNNGAAEVTWDFTGTEVDFSGDRPSKNWYEAWVTVEGGAGCGVRNAVSARTRVVVWSCPPRVEPTVGGAAAGRAVETVRCPNISLCCHEAGYGQLRLVSAQLIGGTPGVLPVYNWTSHGGKIVSGLGTASVMVDVKESAGRTVLTTLEVGGYGPRCSASCVYEKPRCEGPGCNPPPCEGPDCSPCQPQGKYVYVRIPPRRCPGGKCKPRPATYRPAAAAAKRPKPKPRYRRIWVQESCPKISAS